MIRKQEEDQEEEESNTTAAISSKSKIECDNTLITLLVIDFLSNCAYGLMAPFFPKILEEKEIDQSIFGYMFSTYSVAVILCSPVVGHLLLKVKRSTLLISGLSMMSFAIFMFSIANFVESKTLFLVIVFLARFLQGAASSQI